MAEDDVRKFQKAAGNDNLLQAQDIESASDDNCRLVKGDGEPGRHAMSDDGAHQCIPGGIRHVRGFGEALEEAASGDEGFETTCCAATAGPGVGENTRVTEFAADGKRICLQTAFNDDCSAYSLSKVRQQKTFPTWLSHLMAQRESTLLLDQNHGRFPDSTEQTG